MGSLNEVDEARGLLLKIYLKLTDKGEDEIPDLIVDYWNGTKRPETLMVCVVDPCQFRSPPAIGGNPLKKDKPIKTVPILFEHDRTRVIGHARVNQDGISLVFTEQFLSNRPSYRFFNFVYSYDKNDMLLEVSCNKRG